MPVSDNEEHGIKLLARPSSDGLAGMPIKKRRFLFVRSPSPPPERSYLLPGDCDLSRSEHSISEPESSVSDVGGLSGTVVSDSSWDHKGESVADKNAILTPSYENYTRFNHLQLFTSGASADMEINSGGIISGTVGISDSSWEHKGEFVADKNAILAPTYEKFTGFNDQQLFTSGASAGMEINSGGIFSHEDKSAFGPILTKCELRSASDQLLKLPLGEGSGEGKLVQSDKSAFRRVLGNTDLQFPNREGNFLKQDKLDPCSLDLALAKGGHDELDKSSDVESKVDSVHMRANRAHWDLNTKMDMWEGSLSDAAINVGAGGDAELDLGNIHGMKHETCPVQMVHREETYAMVKKCERDYSLHLSNSASFPNKCHSSEAHLTLQLNPASGPQSHLNQGVTSSLSKLNSVRGVSDLCLSVKPMIPTTDLILTAVKPEPFQEGSQKETGRVGTSNLKLVPPETVKLNPASGSQSHLNQGVTSSLAKLNSVRGVTNLCLSVKPMIPTTDMKLAAVKPEPFEEGSHKETRRVGASNLKLFPPETVKHNPASGPQSHLNQVVTSSLAKLNSVREVSDLCLSVKPMIPISDLKLAAVKPEPFEGSQKETSKVEASNLKLLPPETVKLESVGKGSQENPQTMGLSTPNLAHSSVFKAKPRGFPQEGFKTMEGKARHAEFHTPNVESPISRERPQEEKANVFKLSDMVSQSLVTDGNKIYHGPEMSTDAKIQGVACETVSRTSSRAYKHLVPDSIKSVQGPETSLNIETPQDASKILGEATALVPDVNNSQNDQEMPISTFISQNHIVHKASDLLSESMVNVEESTQTQEANDMVDKTSYLLVESVVSDCKGPTVADSMLDVVQMPFLNGDSSKVSALVSSDQHVESYGNTKIPIGEEEVKEDVSSGIPEDELFDNRNESDPHSDVAKRHGGCKNYEDGEVRDSLLHGVVGGPCEEVEAKCVHVEKASDLVDHVDAHVANPHVDRNGSQIQNPVELQIVQCTVECDGTLASERDDLCLRTVTDVNESLAIGVSATGSGKKKPTNSVRNGPQDHLGKEKGLETKPMSNKTLDASGGTVTQDNKGDKVSQHTKAAGSNPPSENCSDLSIVESSISHDAVKHVTSRSNWSRIIHLNSAPSGSSTGRTKSIPGRLILSQIERRLNDKSPREDKPHMQCFRNENRIDGFHKVEKGRNQNQLVGKPGSECMHVRGRVYNHLDALQGKHFSGPKSFRFPKPKNTSEVALASGPDGLIVTAGREANKPVNAELKNVPRLLSRRWSPRGREGPFPVDIQMVRRTTRDTSPGRCIEGGIPDLHRLNHEEKFTRGLVGDMVDHSLFRHPNIKFDRGENAFIQRERRSLSPLQRRDLVHLTNICTTSSPRPQMQSPRMWSPPQRASDGFDGHPELIHCRSLPNFRVDRVRSPHQRGCFPDDMMARRRGSPPYLSRLCRDMREIGPLREDGYPHSSRILQRHSQRFDFIDPREIAEEEFFGPLHLSQVREFVGGDECVDERNGGERHVLLRPFRQHCTVGDDVDDESFPHRVEDGPPRPIRFCPEPGEEFPDRGNSRDFDRSFGNRLGNRPRRLRGMEEQEDNYRDDGGQGWHDAGFNDVRLKRRRF